MQVSERLQKVLAMGDVLALFPLLGDWSTEELQALLKDVDEYAELAYASVDKAWAKAALEPGLLFNAANAKLLDRVRDEKKMEFMMIASEIASVALFYLRKRGVEV